MKDTMSLTLIDRFHPRRRKSLQAAIDAGDLQKRDELELLTPDVMRPLARLGIRMLIAAGIFFIALNFATYFWQKHTLNLGLTFGGVLLWLIINIVGSFLILYMAWHFSSGAENRSSEQNYPSHSIAVRANRSFHATTTSSLAWPLLSSLLSLLFS
jgi:hypothetical protein